MNLKSKPTRGELVRVNKKSKELHAMGRHKSGDRRDLILKLLRQEDMAGSTLTWKWGKKKSVKK